MLRDGAAGGSQVVLQPLLHPTDPVWGLDGWNVVSWSVIFNLSKQNTHLEEPPPADQAEQQQQQQTDRKTSAYRGVLCWSLLDFKRLVSSHEQTTVHLLLLWQAPFLQRDWWWRWLLLSWPILCRVFKLNYDRHHNSSKEIWCETPLLLCFLDLPFPLLKFCNFWKYLRLFWVTDEKAGIDLPSDLVGLSTETYGYWVFLTKSCERFGACFVNAFIKLMSASLSWLWLLFFFNGSHNKGLNCSDF